MTFPANNDDFPTFGNYHCTRLLGQTSDGAVYLAHHLDDPSRPVALRSLHIAGIKLDEVLDECNQHMEDIKNIDAPNLIRVLDYGNEKNTYYLVMQYVEGDSLQRLMHKMTESPDTYPSLGEVGELLKSVGQALSAIHEQGHAHGMIEPRNIWIAPNHNFLVADIGLARLLKITFSLQNTGSFWAGKYSPPEIWMGERMTDRSDLYSLACTMYHLVTGRAPFESPTILGLLDKHEKEMISPPHYVRPDLPSDLSIPFLRATAKAPQERYSTVAKFVDDFVKAIRNHEGDPTGFFTV